MIRILSLLTCLAFFLGAGTAHAQTLCVYDPAGKSGEYYRMVQDFSLEATSMGVQLTLKPYSDEETAVKDYEAGQCDAVLATGVRLQRFNSFPTTIEAIGALPNYALLKDMVTTLTTSAGAAKKLRKGNHETAAIIPVGAVYLFVRDSSMDTVTELAGKRIATLDYDKPSLVMVERVGGIVVPADLGSLGPKFNNGDVDVCYISAPGYQPFELWRGMSTNGGVVKLPLAQATLQLLIQVDRFPEGFANQSRIYFLSRFDDAVGLVTKAESQIDAKYWIPIPSENIIGFEELFQNTRIRLRDNEKTYDPQMLKVMRQLRCSHNSDRAECVENRE